MSQVVDTWSNDVISPYGSAYSEAYARFEKVATLQDRAHQREAELALLGLSLMGGTFLTAAFASAALPALANRAAIHMILVANVRRVISAYSFLEKSPAAGFLLGGLVDSAAKLAGTGISDVVRERLQRTEADIRQFVRTPLAVQNSLTEFVRGHKIAACDIATALVKDRRSPDEKLALLKAMTDSPFYRRPMKPIDRTFLADDIELGFYMSMMMNGDFLSRMQLGRRGPDGFEFPMEMSRTPIEAAVGSRDYPRRRTVSTRPWRWEEVRFAKLGHVFCARIDALHRVRFGIPFFTGTASIDGPTIARAQVTLAKLARPVSHVESRMRALS